MAFTFAEFNAMGLPRGCSRPNASFKANGGHAGTDHASPDFNNG
jgi:hypothetical protein